MSNHHRTNRFSWSFMALLLLSLTAIYVGAYASLVKRHTGMIWMVGPPGQFVSPSYETHYRLWKTVFAPVEWLDVNYVRPGYWSKTEL